MNGADARSCSSCGTSLLAPGDNKTAVRRSASALGAKPRASGARRTGELKVDASAARTEQGDDPAQTTAEDAEPAPAPRARATLQDGGNRRSSGAMKPMPKPLASPPSGASSAMRDPLIGQKLQEYVIKERVGVGGMGVVYRAEQKLINKEVAIKVLRGDVVTDPRDVDRMLDEARIINSIKHRGIINIFGAGTLDDGRHYLIMELLEGESLEQLMLREGTVNAGDVVIILEEVLSALAAAHAAGVVHRDLKPANVFLVKEGNKVYVKLLDFGLARRQQQNVTRIAGTPDYISPEHARGRPAGPPADLYAFGVMCFHMLTGSLPFTGTTPMEVMEKHVHHEPPVPHEVNPKIPKALSELILKLLAKEPGARPDAVQVKADLRAATKQLRNAATMMSLMSVDPVVSERPSADEAERARALAVSAQVEDVKRQVKRRWPQVVGAVVGVWLLAVVGYVFWPSAPVEPPKPIKLPPAKNPPVALTGTDVKKVPVDPPPPEQPRVDTTVTPPPDAVALEEEDAGEVEPEPEPEPVVTGVLGKLPNSNAVVDDFVIGEFKRERRDGQSIESMLDRMSREVEGNAEKAEYFGLKLNKVKAQCDGATTKKTLLDCDDELRRLHHNFYRVE